MAAGVLFPREISSLLLLQRVLHSTLKPNLVASAWQIVFLLLFSPRMLPLPTLLHWLWILFFLDHVLFRNSFTKNPFFPSFLCEWLLKSISSQSCGRNWLIKLQVLFGCPLRAAASPCSGDWGRSGAGFCPSGLVSLRGSCPQRWAHEWLQRGGFCFWNSPRP